MADKPINPWADSGEKTFVAWEDMNAEDGPAVMRLRVPTGWLYLIGKHPPTFVPER